MAENPETAELGHHSHGCWRLQGDKDQGWKDTELGTKVVTEGRQRGGRDCVEMIKFGNL